MRRSPLIENISLVKSFVSSNAVRRHRLVVRFHVLILKPSKVDGLKIFS